MRFTSQTSSDGVTEQLFTLPFIFGEIPGVLWTPDGTAGTRPLSASCSAVVPVQVRSRGHAMPARWG